MARQSVQVAGLEPSTLNNTARYAIQIRGVDSNGNYGPWSQVFLFDSGTDLPFDIDEGVEEVQAGDLLFYTGTDWRGTPSSDFARTNIKSFFGEGVASIPPEDPADVATKEYVDNRNVIGLVSDGIEIDFSERDDIMTRTCEGNIVITAINYEPAASKTIRFIAGANNRAFVFPAGWKFLGDVPPQVDAGKTGVLTLTCFGDTEADVVAAWGQQS
jgi:hypothetical protein